MVATINPCGFAMLPAYVSYYLASGEGNPGLSRTLPRLLHALAVLLVGAGAYIVYYWLTAGQLLWTFR